MANKPETAVARDLISCMYYYTYRQALTETAAFYWTGETALISRILHGENLLLLGSCPLVALGNMM